MRTSLRDKPRARRGRAVAAIGAAGALVAGFIATAPPAAASAATAAATTRPPAAAVAKARPSAAADSCAHPTFAHGQAQNVFSSNPSTWVRGEAWVQTTDDSDHDGVPDRIHVDITRPAETANPACGYKAPVIFEESPYYAGLGPEFTWPVDYELGNPPPPRVPEPNWTARNTSPIISTIYESTWLPRGFAVVHAEAPGTGLSTGCPTGGGPNETEAGKAVVEWLNGKAPAFSSPTSDQQVYANWTNGNVGMTGTSYNGTLAEAVATTGVQGLKAIVPVSGISDWYDYYRANGMVRAPFTFQGEDLDVLADVVYSRADRSICRSEIDGLVNEEDRVTGDFSQYWAARDYMPDVRHVHAAVLMAHGNNDFNVMTKNMAQFYEAIKAQGVPHMLYFHQAGHGGAPPDVLMNLWFTRYLFGVHNNVEQLPRAWIVREANACPVRQTTAVGDQSNTTTLTVADTRAFSIALTPSIQVSEPDGTVRTATGPAIIAIPDRTHLILSAPVATGTGEKVADGASISLVCSSRGNPVPYADWPDPADGPATLHFTAGAPGIGGLTLGAASAGNETLADDATITARTSAQAATSDVRLLYQSPVLSQNVRISGVPWLSLDMSSSKPKANLTGVLVDYAPDGTATILTRGWLDPENRDSAAVTEPVTPGTFYRLRFDMQPKDSVITAGHRIGVMILSSDNEATIRPAPGTQLTMDLARSSVHLPVVGGAAALAEATGTGTTDDQMARLSDVVGGLGLSQQLTASLQGDLAQARQQGNACGPLRDFVQEVLDQAAAASPGLTMDQAGQLLSVDVIETELGCITPPDTGPWVSPQTIGQAFAGDLQAAQGDLLDLAGTIDGFSLDQQTAAGLLDDAAAAADQTVAHGPAACDTLAALTKTITSDTRNGTLSADQAATLNGSLSQIRPELGC